jgi:hypothetical protein
VGQFAANLLSLASRILRGWPSAEHASRVAFQSIKTLRGYYG